jgi:hypothetical protein
MKIIITEEEKKLIRKMYLMEGGDDPLTPTSTEKLTIPKLGFDQQNILKSNLWGEIKKNENLIHKLGLDSSHNEENFLNKISHMTHAHYDPITNHLGISFANLGNKHNLTFNLGLGLTNHNETHNNSHDQSHTSTLIPHSVFDVGIKLPLKSIFGK